MVDVPSWLGALETNWPYSIPIAAVLVLAFAWLVGSRAAEPPRLQPRIYRTNPTEAFSQLYGELHEVGIARILRADVDQYLTAKYQVTLARLPRTRRGARARGMTSLTRGVGYFRALHRDLRRFSRLSRSGAAAVGAGPATRRQAMRSRESVDLGQHLIEEVRRLDGPEAAPRARSA